MAAGGSSGSVCGGEGGAGPADMSQRGDGVEGAVGGRRLARWAARRQQGAARTATTTRPSI